MLNIGLLILLFIGSFTSNLLPKKLSSKKIELYSFYTPSHAIFKNDWFVPSIKDDFELKIYFFEQECDKGDFNSDGWNTTMSHKVDMIIDAIIKNWGNIFIYADIDIQFFRSMSSEVIKLMENNDIIIQRDDPKGEVCAGFFVCRGNEQTLELWTKIKELMIKKGKRDQQALNFILKNKKCDVKWSYLPSEFLSGGTLTGERWSPGKELFIPENIFLHHANWTVGIENKIAQLEYVAHVIQNRG